MKRVFTTLSLLVIPLALAVGGQEVDFNRDVRPILNKNCTSCHGGVKKAGEVSFLFRDDVLGMGESGAQVVVPGEADQSEMIRRILTSDPDDRMPPPDHHPKPLDAESIATLKRWINQGAEWGEHWAFVPPEAKELPKVQLFSWPRQPLDHFVLARHEREGLSPSPVAEPHRLLRRLSFALTGLPPTPDELTAFSGEWTSDPDAALEGAVDRLLASPAFGEHWTSVWLDLARYSDSMGYEKDLARTIWSYRDWLIRAFNEDLPYDQFLIKQLAGDLLPDATLDDHVATAFLRNSQTNTEGGTDDEEFRVAALLDRVDTVWTSTQGFTFRCVQCHSHPYDPISHEEFYEFAAFFNNTADADLNNDFPKIQVPNDRARNEEVLSLTQAVKRCANEIMNPFLALATESPWSDFSPEHYWTNKPQAKLTSITADGRPLTVIAGNAASRSIYEVVGRSEHETISAIRLESLMAPGTSSNTPSKNFAVTKFELRLRRVGQFGQEDSFEDIPLAFVVNDEPNGYYESPQWGAFPSQFHDRFCVLIPKEPIALGPEDRLSVVLHQNQGRDGGEQAALRRFALSTSDSGEWNALLASPAHQSLVKEKTEAAAALKAIPGTTVPVLAERARYPRSFAVFNRGNFLDKTTPVSPGTPAALPPLETSSGAAPTRLDAAHWITSPNNPLTNRVLVNRVWAQLFGLGLVETLEDFGSTGTPPSHPDLLDHLALRFRDEHQSSLKSLLREVTTSATFLQSARRTSQDLARDPQNRLLTRGPRNRLSAEMVRDHLLASAGQLSKKMFGPPVMPPQPEGIWKIVYSNQKWVTPDNEDRHRRALYTYWRRGAPYPSFQIFDAPERRVCSARRITTNTPLHSLVTLNDPVYLEAAQGLAKRISQKGRSLDEQLSLACLLCTSEEPDEATLATLRDLHEGLREDFTAHPAEAAKIAATPELAALTVTAQTIMNLDSSLTW